MKYSNDNIKKIRNYIVIGVVILFISLVGYSLLKSDSENNVDGETVINLKGFLIFIVVALVVTLLVLIIRMRKLGMSSPREEIGRIKVIEKFKEEMLKTCKIPTIYINNKAEPQKEEYFRIRDENVLSAETGELFCTFTVIMEKGTKKGQWFVAIPKDRGMKYIEENLYDMMVRDKDYDNYDLYDEATPLRSNLRSYNRRLISELEKLQSEFGKEQTEEWFDKYRVDETRKIEQKPEDKKEKKVYEYKDFKDNTENKDIPDDDIKDKIKEYSRRKNANYL